VPDRREGPHVRQIGSPADAKQRIKAPPLPTRGDTLRRKVVITDRPLTHIELEREIVSKAGGELEVHDCKDRDELTSALRHAYVALVNLAPIDRAVITGLSETKGIIRYGIGYDNVDVKAATEKGIYFANVPGYCTVDVAEHTLGLILSLTRRIPELDSYVRRGLYIDTSGWKHYRPMLRLAGKAVGLVGLGRIGREVAKRLLAFDASVLVYDPYLKPDGLGDLAGTVSPVDLASVLRKSDIISIHVPLTTETRGMIGRKELAMMKKTAYLLNASRGGIVDEAALARAVESGVIAGAALDTLASEPPARDSPVLNRDRILVTPHVAWYSEESVIELERRAAEQAAQILRGEAPTHLVNVELLAR